MPRHSTVIFFLCALSAPAAAAEWGDFASAFPVFPCADGWVACRVGEAVIGPDLRPGEDGVPRRADDRLDWATLAPTALFAPFADLSAYEGPRVVAPPPVVAPEPARVAVRRETPRLDTPVVAPPSDPPPAPIQEAKASNAASCADFDALVPAAKEGRLSAGQLACLEAGLGEGSRAERRQRSSLLLANAWRTAGWEALAVRHLADVDPSDADVSFQLAVRTYQERPERGDDVVRWADQALAGSTVWTGDRYRDRVLTLHKVRAGAAHRQWTAEPTPERTARAGALAKEWFAFAKETGKGAEQAAGLCAQLGLGETCGRD